MLRLSKLLTFSLLITLSIVFSSCEFHFIKEEITARKLKVGLSSSFSPLTFVPLYISDAQNYFSTRNLSVEFEVLSSPILTTEERISEQYDVMMIDPSFFYWSGRESLNYVNISAAVKTNSFLLLAREQKDNFSWKDLKNKVVIGTTHGEFSQYLLENELWQHNLQPCLQVHIIQNLPLEEKLSVFKAGTGQFFLASEPQASQLEKEICGKVVAELGESFSSLYIGSFVVSEQNLSIKRNALQDFINAYYESLLWIKNSTAQEIANVVKDYYPLIDEDLLLDSIVRFKELNAWPESPLLSSDDISHWQHILAEAKVITITTKPPLLDNSLALKALETVPLQSEKDNN